MESIYTYILINFLIIINNYFFTTHFKSNSLFMIVTLLNICLIDKVPYSVTCTAFIVSFPSSFYQVLRSLNAHEYD